MSHDAEQKITHHLEMASRQELRPSARTIAELDVRRVEIPSPELNWFFHQLIGHEFRWGGREGWGRPEWTAYVDRPELETWVAYLSGTPAGYYELEKQADGSVRIECFGLSGPFIGKGLGSPLLTGAVERCWEMGANRVWLNTCSHDHPHALQNYLARGFRLVGESVGPPNPHTQSMIFQTGKIGSAE